MSAQLGSIKGLGLQVRADGGASYSPLDRARGGPLWRTVARALNARAPINSLPPEVLCAIFGHVDQTALFCLPSHVCSHWRATALAEPRLWTRIHTAYWHALEAIPVLLERSGSAPVDMELSLGGKRLGVIGTTPQPAGTSTVVEGCARALAAHIGHIVRLTVFAHSRVEFAAVVGLASQHPSSNLRYFDIHIAQSLGSSPVSLCGFGALRTIVTNTHPEPGDWMRRLEYMKLDYPVSIKQLFSLLAYTPSLKSLHLTGPVLDSLYQSLVSMPTLLPEMIDPRIKQLRLRQFICERASDCVPIFANTLALKGIETLIIVPCVPFSPFLLDGTDDTITLALDVALAEQRIALTDARGRRRMFSTLGGTRALSLMRDRLPNVERITFLARHTSVLRRSPLWDLHALSLDRLGTVIWEVEDFLLDSAVPANLREAIRHAIDTMDWVPLRLPTALPALRDIALIPTPTTLRSTKTAISAVPVLRIVERILADPAAPRPRLRLVYLRLAPDDDERERGARQKLREKVACIMEESWDGSVCQSWYGMPEYALGREIVTRDECRGRS